MPDISKQSGFPNFSSGTIKALVFILLVGITIAFWLYTQLIIDHVRNFQQSVVNTQKDIYVNIITPSYSDTSSVNSELFQKGVIDSPFPSIFSDEDNNPLPGLWRKVGIEANDTSEESMKKLKKLIEKMDRINLPDTISTPALIPHTDTLTVYEIPPSRFFPAALTDQLGNLLYHRNINVSTGDSVKIIISQLDNIPKHFFKENEPPLIYYREDSNRRWPLIITKNDRTPLYWQDVNIASTDTTSQGMALLKSRMREMRQRGIVYNVVTSYISGYNKRIFHYGDPIFLTWIVWLPVIEFLVIFILISIGFIGFKNIQNAEQRSIWIGMAKETAHQLGTPISSLSGWHELLKSEQNIDMLNKAMPEMEYDVMRLTKVAARFSSVGSKPEVKPIILSDVIDEVLEYFRARAPRMGKSVHIEGHYEGLRPVPGNHELLNWAFENMIKNSLSAIESREGFINVDGNMSKDFQNVIVDFTDNGRGIVPANQKKIMKPGFTTKKRGWGLGLSLIKRIVEDYHGGKVFLLESKPGVATTFRVILPAVKEKN
ncbi:sensor histidine kinase [Candidatus Latescibacterota bacterium]